MKINGKKLILLQINLCMGMKLLVAILPKLSFITYFTDIINIGIIVFAIKKHSIKKQSKQFKTVCIWFILLFVFDIVFLYRNGQKLALFLWGIRNQYRFILFLIASVIILEPRDLPQIADLLKRWFVINLPIVTVEFLLGYRMDFLGGTFGLERGCNAIVNIFLCIITSIILIQWFNKKISLRIFLLYFIGVLYWAVVSEIKVYFIELVLIVLVTLVLVRGNEIKKLSIILIGVICAIFGVIIMSSIFPYYKNFFRLNKIVDYMYSVNLGYAGFGRMSAIDYTNRLFFNNEIKKLLFGLGTGSAEFSTISFLNSSFFAANEKYQYFSYFHAFMYIERGLFGLVWYFALFLRSIITACFEAKKNNISRDYLQISVLVSLSSVITMVYDIALRTSTSAYLAFLVLGFPYICQKQHLPMNKKQINVAKIYGHRSYARNLEEFPE